MDLNKVIAELLSFTMNISTETSASTMIIKVISVYLQPIFVPYGFVCIAIVLVTIFRKSLRKTPTSIYMGTLAIIDNINLVTVSIYGWIIGFNSNNMANTSDLKRVHHYVFRCNVCDITRILDARQHSCWEVCSCSNTFKVQTVV